MTVKSAITPAFSLLLDIVRALAAGVVVIGHAGQLGLYSGYWPFTEMLQHSAVIIFFMLSGLVIAETTLARMSTARDYAIARFARIVPVALAGIGLGNLVWLLAALRGLPLAQPAGYDQANLPSFILPFLFLTETDWGSGPVANPPFWSLCYEVWYYILFGLACFLRGPRRIVALGAAILLAGPRVLVLLPVWLAGVLMQRRLSRAPMSLLRGGLCVIGGAMAVLFVADLTFGLSAFARVLTGVGTSYWRHSEYWLSDWLMAPGIAAIFLGLAAWSQSLEPWVARWRPAIRKASGSSFTLYMVHWPILSLMAASGISTANALLFACLVAAVFGLAMVTASLLEARATPALRSWLRARFRQTGGGVTDSGQCSRSIAM